MQDNEHVCHRRDSGWILNFAVKNRQWNTVQSTIQVTVQYNAQDRREPVKSSADRSATVLCLVHDGWRHVYPPFSSDGQIGTGEQDDQRTKPETNARRRLLQNSVRLKARTLTTESQPHKPMKTSK